MSLCLRWSPILSNPVRPPNFPFLMLNSRNVILCLLSSRVCSLQTLHGSHLSPSRIQNPFRQFCSQYSGDIHVPKLAYDKTLSPKHEQGSADKEASVRGVFPKTNEMVEKLKRYGVAGLLSYGLLNTAYYSITFLLVWFYVAPAPAKMGYFVAVQRFLKTMAMVWAGSQVTKILRAGGALALAPFVDKGLSWFTARFKFKSQGQAFMAIVASCFGFAILLFLAVTMISA